MVLLRRRTTGRLEPHGTDEAGSDTVVTWVRLFRLTQSVVYAHIAHPGAVLLETHRLVCSPGGDLELRYFIDPDTHWDVTGYWQQVRSLEPRLARATYGILSKTSFHDAQVLTMQVNNLGTWGRPRIKDPMDVVIRLWHPNEYVYTLNYSGVTAMDFDFNWRKQTYLDLDGAERCYQEDQGGIHDWLYDELTPYDDTYLSHEVQFASSASLLLLFRRLSCARSVRKRRYEEA